MSAEFDKEAKQEYLAAMRFAAKPGTLFRRVGRLHPKDPGIANHRVNALKLHLA
jgi:hypothetical protein